MLRILVHFELTLACLLAQTRRSVHHMKGAAVADASRQRMLVVINIRRLAMIRIIRILACFDRRGRNNRGLNTSFCSSFTKSSV